MPVCAGEKTRLSRNLGVASGDPSLQDNKKLSTKWKARARLRQYILVGVTESYYHASPVGQILNIDIGTTSYQYKHEDNFKIAPASMMDLGGLTLWEDLHELGSKLFEDPERNVPARNNCPNGDDSRADRNTDSKIKPPLEIRKWAEQKQQQEPDRVSWLQRERNYGRDSDLDYPVLAPTPNPIHAPAPQKGSEQMTN